MKIVFQNNETVELVLNDSLTAERFKKMYKHLQHIPLNFKPWDSCFYRNSTSLEQHVDNLITFANKLSIEIDRNKCINRDQNYLNYLHKTYEKNYDGNSVWLDFHHHVHLCEDFDFNEKVCNRIIIDYREKGGLITKTIDKEILKELTTEVKQGQIYTSYGELGKTPYTYFCDNEPNDIKRLVELVKPWSHLKPKFMIAIDDYDFTNNSNMNQFEIWWQNFVDQYCEFYNIEKYDNTDTFGVLVFGYVKEFDKLVNLLMQNILPTKVSL